MSVLAAPLLIFSGCCSNVYALEAILKHEANSGLLITLMQFIFVAMLAYPSQASSHGPFFLRKTAIPWQALLKSAAMFYLVNMLNNWAFAFNISVPVHIILRSFGSVTTMAAGWLNGKTYSQVQTLSVVMLTVGVLVSAWADAESKGKSLDTKINVADSSFELGLLVLLVAQLLSSYMGIYVQNMYAEHGTHWQENLFYSHIFSIPFFLPFQSSLMGQYQSLQNSSPPQIPTQIIPYIPTIAQKMVLKIPTSVFHLLLNSLTQCLCITGVNLLGSRSSAVTVTIVLNIRKLVSFMLSVWLFGNTLSNTMIVGATIVFASGALYGLDSSVRRKKPEQPKAAAVKNGKHKDREL